MLADASAQPGTVVVELLDAAVADIAVNCPMVRSVCAPRWAIDVTSIAKFKYDHMCSFWGFYSIIAEVLIVVSHIEWLMINILDFLPWDNPRISKSAHGHIVDGAKVDQNLHKWVPGAFFEIWVILSLKRNLN